MDSRLSNKGKKKGVVTLAIFLWMAPDLLFSYQRTVESVEKGGYTDRHEFSLQFEQKKMDEIKNAKTL